MKPRVLYRTHYQVDEPFYMELLVRECTSPVQSAYPERVAACLSESIRGRGKQFNVAAAGYAVDLARGLGLITENSTWTEQGHLLALCTKVGAGGLADECELNGEEKLAHFRVFLSGDGAALLYIARVLRSSQEIPEDGDWNKFAQKMFTDLYAEYLKSSADIRDRLQLRNEIARLRKPFRGKTGHHKCYVHFQSLARLGLLERRERDGQRTYCLVKAGREAFEALLHAIPSVLALEAVVDHGTWADVATQVFGLTRQRTPGRDDVLRLIAETYAGVSKTGVPLCPIETLLDAVQIKLLAGSAGHLERAEVVRILEDAQRSRPQDVRFHVDRRGRPAFVKMSPGVNLLS